MLSLINLPPANHSLYTISQMFLSKLFLSSYLLHLVHSWDKVVIEFHKSLFHLYIKNILGYHSGSWSWAQSNKWMKLPVSNYLTFPLWPHQQNIPSCGLSVCHEMCHNKFTVTLWMRSDWLSNREVRFGLVSCHTSILFIWWSTCTMWTTMKTSYI